MSKGFFEAVIGQNPKPQSVAILLADDGSGGARENIKAASKPSTRQHYPPATTDFAPIVRAIQETNLDTVSQLASSIPNLGPKYLGFLPDLPRCKMPPETCQFPL